MRAVQLQQAQRAATIAKGDEILAEDAQPPGQIAQFLGEDDRLPKAAQILAAWRARPDAGELFVRRGALAMMIRAVGGVQKWCSCQHRVRPPARCVVLFTSGPQA